MTGVLQSLEWKYLIKQVYLYTRSQVQMYIAEAQVKSAVGLVIDVLQLNKKHIQAQVHTHKRRGTPICKQKRP